MYISAMYMSPLETLKGYSLRNNNKNKNNKNNNNNKGGLLIPVL